MPTGYTHSISEGISFEKFTLNCAKAFGALISIRDEPSDAPIPTEIKPSDYNLKALKKAQADLKKYESMKLSEAKLLCQKQYDDELKRIQESELKNAKLKTDYELMLSKVKKWIPPTPEHEGLKKFMIEQIETSIQWDCGHERSKPKKQSPEQWLFAKKKQAINDIDYHTKGHNEEVQRCAERTKWIQDLIKSLDV
jgi:hypothetical protein